VGGVLQEYMTKYANDNLALRNAVFIEGATHDLFFDLAFAPQAKLDARTLRRDINVVTLTDPGDIVWRGPNNPLFQLGGNIPGAKNLTVNVADGDLLMPFHGVKASRANEVLHYQLSITGHHNAGQGYYGAW